MIMHNARRRLLVAVAAAMILAGCGTVPQFTPGNTTDTLGQAPAADTTTGTPAAMPPSTSPPPVTGNSAAAALQTARDFAVGFSNFSPFDFDPAAEWFDTWSGYAAPALIGRMQITINDWWAWTWQTQRKAFDAEVTAATVTADHYGTTAVAVTVSRLLLGMNDTGDKAIRQTVDYRISVDRTAAPPQVVAVDRIAGH